MKLVRMSVDEQAIRRLGARNGPLGRKTDRLAGQVVDQAVVNASGRPGPNIRSGDLIRHTKKAWTVDRQGNPVVDVGSDALSPRQKYPYPVALETGRDPRTGKKVPRYPWLRKALQDVFTQS